LNQLKGCILTNHLLVRYFGEKLYIYSFIVQVLQALAFLNSKGEIHGDISPMSLVVKLLETTDLFSVKVLDFLGIRDLVDLAQNRDSNGLLLR
jgi:serine/threonine protein kinase